MTGNERSQFRGPGPGVGGRSAQERRDELGLGDLGVGQAVEAALVGVGELAVVQAQGVEQGGVEVVDGDDVVDRRRSRSRRSRRGRSRA